MVFTPPAWMPKLPFEPPDSIPISEFVLDEKYGRTSFEKSKAPFTCGLTGVSYSASEVRDRVDLLARGLAEELQWTPNGGSEWDKVIGIFAVNTIDNFTLMWATHRLSGICSPANAAYSAPELVYQLKTSGVKTLFTCAPLLPIALEAAAQANIPSSRVYLIDVPKRLHVKGVDISKQKTVDQLIEQGKEAPLIEELKWENGRGKKQCALLCYSSGTSGLPKGVMISHYNVIANILQFVTAESPSRAKGYLDVVLGILPQSHMYALVLVCHGSVYRGDGVINLPKFDMQTYLAAIQKFKINSLFIVPPIVIAMTQSKQLLDKFDLSSVKTIYTGAAPLGPDTAARIQKMLPAITIRQAYGLTECAVLATMTSPNDVWFGSCGSLIPSFEAKIVSIEGNEITGYDQPGELLLKSPSVVLGYLQNEKSTKETFQDGWLRTGDEAVIRKSPRGHEHVFIVDRIKELIKVKGMQVAPAELEEYLLTHPAVADAAVISVADEAAGELPKAFIVKSASVGLEDNDRMLKREIAQYVEKGKTRYKWLKGGIDFIDVIPKSPSGKILRRMLRDKEKESRRTVGPRL